MQRMDSVDKAEMWAFPSAWSQRVNLFCHDDGNMRGCEAYWHFVVSTEKEVLCNIMYVVHMENGWAKPFWAKSWHGQTSSRT